MHNETGGAGVTCESVEKCILGAGGEIWVKDTACKTYEQMR